MAKKVIKKQSTQKQSAEKPTKVFGIALTHHLIIIVGIVLLFTVLAPVGIVFILFGGFQGIRKAFFSKKKTK